MERSYTNIVSEAYDDFSPYSTKPLVVKSLQTRDDLPVRRPVDDSKSNTCNIFLYARLTEPYLTLSVSWVEAWAAGNPEKYQM